MIRKKRPDVSRLKENNPMKNLVIAKKFGETKKRPIKEGKIRLKAWNKGLTKENDKRIRKGAEKSSKTKKGVSTRYKNKVSLEIMKKIPQEVLFEMYITQKKGIPQISKEIGIGTTTIWRYLKFYNIPIIDISKRYFNCGKLKKILTKEVLYEKYVLEEKSFDKIAKELGVGNKTIEIYLHRNGIESRSRSEAMKGKKTSEKTKQKQRLSHIGLLKGEKHPSFNNWSSREPYGLEFSPELREQIRKRDNYRCQQCFRHQDELFTKKGNKRRLTIHHIDFDKKNNNPTNLTSLCCNCHIQTNFNREDWTDYFQNRVGGL